MTKELKIELEAGNVLFTQDEESSDLFLVKSGKLMACFTNGTQVTPVAYIEAKEYIGEMSFFDKEPRSAHIITVEPSTIIRIPVGEINSQMPQWLVTLAKSMTRNIRETDRLIAEKGTKKRKNLTTIEPLSIDDQRKYFQIIKDYKERNNI